MAHFIGIKQPDGQIKPIMDFENSTPVKISLTPVRDKQDKVLIPFYYVDTENQEYTIELGSFTIDYKKRPVQKDDQLILHLKINKKGALRVELIQPQHKVKVFNIFKYLKKKQRSKRVELAKELKLTPRPEKKETPGQAGKQEAEGKPKTQPFKIILMIIYALILAVIIFFLITQTFEELSLEKLFGIKL
jgi:hypothetical protein